MRRQIYTAFQSAEFDGSETMLLREVQDFLQVPSRAAESGKRKRQTRRFSSGRECGSHHCAREFLRKFSSRRSHGAAPPAVAGASLPLRWKSVKDASGMPNEMKTLRSCCITQDKCLKE